LKRNKIP